MVQIWLYHWYQFFLYFFYLFLIWYLLCIFPVASPIMLPTVLASSFPVPPIFASVDALVLARYRYYKIYLYHPQSSWLFTRDDRTAHRSIQIFLEVIAMCVVLQHHTEGNHWQCHYTCFFIFSFRIKHCSSFDGIWILGGFFISLMDNETHSFYLSYRLYSFFQRKWCWPH
jgi:hypothetical protein